MTFQYKKIEDQKALAFVSQELTNSRACLRHLDSTVDEKHKTLRSAQKSSKVVFAEPHVVKIKYTICEEVEKPKGGAGS